MPREKRQLPGEIRDGLVMYAGGTTWHFIVRWRGKIKRGDTKCESRTAALEWLKAERQRWPLEEQGLIGPTARTLGTVWQEWDRLVGEHRSKTHQRYMSGVVHQHAAAFLDRPITDLDQVAFDELKHAYLSGTGQGFKRGGGFVVRKHSEGGWNKVAGQLRALYRWAMERKWILEVPFKVKLERPSPGTRGVLWPEQVQGFLAAVDRVRRERKGDLVPHAGIAVRLMVGLGLRENEALNMEWDRIDWRRHVAIVSMAITTGRKVKDRENREVPIPDWLEDYLRAWWAFCERPAGGLLMVAVRGKAKGKAHGEGATKKAVLVGARALRIVGLTPHGLRRTFATNLWETGTDVNRIAEMMGHDDPRLTMARYIIQRPRANADAQERAAIAMGFKPRDTALSTNGSTTTFTTSIK